MLSMFIAFTVVALIFALAIFFIRKGIRRVDMKSPVGQVGARVNVLIVVCLAVGGVLFTLPPIAEKFAPGWHAIGNVFLPNSGNPVLDPGITAPDPSQYALDANGTLHLQDPQSGYDSVLYWDGGTSPPGYLGAFVPRGTTVYPIGQSATNARVIFLSRDKKRATLPIPIP